MTAGDAKFVSVYETYYRNVYAYCRRRTGPDRVDDAVAEVFLIAWRRIGELPDGGSRSAVALSGRLPSCGSPVPWCFSP